MENGIAIIIGMSVVTVGSAVTQKIFMSVGKSDEASMLDLATKSLISVTALTIFASVIRTLGTLQ